MRGHRARDTLAETPHLVPGVQMGRHVGRPVNRPESAVPMRTRALAHVEHPVEIKRSGARIGRKNLVPDPHHVHVITEDPLHVLPREIHLLRTAHALVGMHLLPDLRDVLLVVADALVHAAHPTAVLDALALLLLVGS